METGTLAAAGRKRPMSSLEWPIIGRIIAAAGAESLILRVSSEPATSYYGPRTASV
jgi:hypothetical protein